VKAPALPGWLLAAFAWGLAEAVLLPVVPDVILTLIAQRFGLRAGLLGCAAAIVGAMLGGLVMWIFGAADPVAMRAMLDALPAIHPGMVAEAEAALAEAPLAALLVGSVTGVPYKVFAGLAPEAGVSAALLLALTPLARAPRFLFATIAAAAFDRMASRLVPRDVRTALVIGFWLVFYAIFWARMDG
jgi:membrane protein YqaA with SNARE-associated domain